MAFNSANEEAFLEAQQLAFEYFDGKLQRLIFDNVKIAAKDGFGQNAKLQDRYFSFSAHYAFDLDFCNPVKGNEKGQMENLVGYYRRHFLVPILKINNIDEVNAHLKSACIRYH